jgi:hypothetical protein
MKVRCIDNVCSKNMTYGKNYIVIDYITMNNVNIAYIIKNDIGEITYCIKNSFEILSEEQKDMNDYEKLLDEFIYIEKHRMNHGKASIFIGDREV